MGSDAEKSEQMREQVELAALLCSRLCHDLVSPIGAISTGMEILVDENDDGMRQQVMGMLTTSIQQASNRLQFARMAYGAGTSMGGTIDMNEARRLSDALVEGGKVVLDWQTSVAQAPKMTVKLLMNLIMIGVETLPRGGVLHVSMENQGEQYQLELTGKGTGATVRADCMEALTGNSEIATMEPRAAQAYYASLLAKIAGLSLTIDNGEDLVKIQAK